MSNSDKAIDSNWTHLRHHALRWRGLEHVQGSHLQRSRGVRMPCHDSRAQVRGQRRYLLHRPTPGVGVQLCHVAGGVRSDCMQRAGVVEPWVVLQSSIQVLGCPSQRVLAHAISHAGALGNSARGGGGAARRARRVHLPPGVAVMSVAQNQLQTCPSPTESSSPAPKVRPPSTTSPVRKAILSDVYAGHNVLAVNACFRVLGFSICTIVVAPQCVVERIGRGESNASKNDCHPRLGTVSSEDLRSRNNWHLHLNLISAVHVHKLRSSQYAS